ncbi:hypothetical protein DI005_00560 [Prauserella sp. PE36]|nr:hypothetical protein DI005_00560 [Prauserella sp. PE36]
MGQRPEALTAGQMRAILFSALVMTGAAVGFGVFAALTAAPEWLPWMWCVLFGLVAAYQWVRYVLIRRERR